MVSTADTVHLEKGAIFGKQIYTVWGRGGGEWERKPDSEESQYSSENDPQYWSMALIDHDQDFTFHFELSVNYTARLMIAFWIFVCWQGFLCDAFET